MQEQLIKKVISYAMNMAYLECRSPAQRMHALDLNDTAGARHLNRDCLGQKTLCGSTLFLVHDDHAV